MKKTANKPATDPTLPNVTIKLQGTIYQLVFTYASLALVERKLEAKGHKVNMFRQLDFTNVSADSLTILLFAAVQAQHPDLSYEEVTALVTLQNAARVLKAVVDAYVASMADPDEDDLNPTQPE